MSAPLFTDHDIKMEALLDDMVAFSKARDNFGLDDLIILRHKLYGAKYERLAKALGIRLHTTEGSIGLPTSFPAFETQPWKSYPSVHISARVTAPIRFANVPSLLRTLGHTHKLQGAPPTECPICCEDTRGGACCTTCSQFVCASCSVKISACPFCRTSNTNTKYFKFTPSEAHAHSLKLLEFIKRM